MRKIFSLLLIAALLISACIPAVSAEESLNGLTLARSLVRVSADSYEYFTYSPATFDQEGLMGSITIDLDGDGADERLDITLTAENNCYLVICENENGDWTPSNSHILFPASFTCNVQANDVFLKQVDGVWYIINENWTQENCMADGAAWSLNAYTYDAEKVLHTVCEYYVDGTDVFGTLEEWKTDAYLLEDRPELKEIAEAMEGFGFTINGLYWGNMIAEQDASLTMLSRVMSVQEIPYETISDFISAGGSALEGFCTFIVDCSTNGYVLPAGYYLSSNEAVFYEEPTFDFTGTGTVIEETESVDESEYIIADSDVRALTADELSAYDKDTLALIRNEILARYGYPFQKQMYRDYFESKSWYTRNEGFTYNMLTSLEMENIELIKKLEAK